jgi:hypothetical protein
MNEENKPEMPDDELSADDERVRHLFTQMLAQADEHVQGVARRSPGLQVRRSGDTPLEGEWELFLVDRDNDDEIVVVGVFSSLQLRQPQQG